MISNPSKWSFGRGCAKYWKLLNSKTLCRGSFSRLLLGDWPSTLSIARGVQRRFKPKQVPPFNSVYATGRYARTSNCEFKIIGIWVSWMVWNASCCFKARCLPLQFQRVLGLFVRVDYRRNHPGGVWFIDTARESKHCHGTSTCIWVIGVNEWLRSSSLHGVGGLWQVYADSSAESYAGWTRLV